MGVVGLDLSGFLTSRSIDMNREQTRDQGRIRARGILPFQESIGNAIDGIVILGLLGQLGETGELYGEGANLCQDDVCTSAMRLRGKSRHPAVKSDGHPVRCVERTHQDVSKFNSLVQQNLVLCAAQIIGREHTTEVANGGLKERNVLSLRSSEINLTDRLDGIVKFILEAHNPQCIQCIDQSGCPSAEGVASTA